MLVITVDILKSHRACPRGIRDFREIFGESLEIDSKEEAVRLALKFCHALEIGFLANLIKDTGAYREAKAPLWEAYLETKASLWKTYGEANAPLWEAYEEAKEPLWKAYLGDEAKLIAEMLWEESRA